MAFPSDLVRTKNWGTETLTDSDLEGQLDLIINWVMAALNNSTGHDHSGSNKGKAITLAASGSGVTGVLPYANGGTGLSALGAAFHVLRVNSGATGMEWAANPRIFIGTSSRDETTATGSQAITGVGFAPRFIIVFGSNPTTQRWSMGTTDGTKNYCIHTFDGTQYMDVDSTKLIRTNKNTHLNTAVISSLDSDGFTLSWVKTGSPTGTFTFYYFCVA